jgi:hypothetical protein
MIVVVGDACKLVRYLCLFYAWQSPRACAQIIYCKCVPMFSTHIVLCAEYSVQTYRVQHTAQRLSGALIL